MRWLLLLLLASCGGNEPAALIHGARVTLDGEPWADVEATLRRCSTRPLHGLYVRFVADADTLCPQHSAGCYHLVHDTAIVEHAATVEESALAHELVHRRLAARGDPDIEHRAPEWRAPCEAP